MRKLRLAIILPVLQCGLEGVLWYWGRHSNPSVFFLEGLGVPSATVISEGANAPAYISASLIYKLLDWLWSIRSPQQTFGPAGFELVFFLCVLGTWYVIGGWLDRRASGHDELGPPRFTARRLLFRLLLLGMGVFFLLWSFHLGTSFSENIEGASLRTWAVFLIAIPGLALTRQLRKICGGGGSSKSAENIGAVSWPPL